MERKYLEYLVEDGRIILEWIFEMWNGNAWTGFIRLRTGKGGGLL
jgi:hypothetical protein